MSKKQFTLDSWLKDKSQKVVTRCGFPVRIVCTDVKRKDYPILALVERDDQEEYQSFTKDGRFSLYNPLHDNFDLFIETADEVSEDEKVRKEIINYFRCQSEEEPTRKEIHNKWIAWLENFPVIIDHEKREGFHLGYKACLERQGEQEKDILEDAILDGNEDGLIAETIRYKNEKQAEQKAEENKGNIGGISSDEAVLDALIRRLKGEDIHVSPHLAVECLESLKGRVQPKQEWSEEDEEILRTILSDGIRGAELDMLQVNWLKSLRPRNHWKPSDEQMELLSEVQSALLGKDCHNRFTGFMWELKKLKEE